MIRINLLYIDDSIDPHITRYFDTDFKSDNVEIISDEYQFNPEVDTYKTIVESQKIKKADVIIIDSKLFENSKPSFGKITGEQLRIIITKFFPYKAILVISQNGVNNELGILGKYNTSKEGTPSDYYNAEWKEYIEKAIKEVIVIRNINSELKRNESIESVVKEKIENALDGICQYDELSKQDIDECIKAFKEIKKIYENE